MGQPHPMAKLEPQKIMNPSLAGHLDHRSCGPATLDRDPQLGDQIS